LPKKLYDYLWSLDFEQGLPFFFGGSLHARQAGLDWGLCIVAMAYVLQTQPCFPLFVFCFFFGYGATDTAQALGVQVQQNFTT